jgi:hypothetical protein
MSAETSSDHSADVKHLDYYDNKVEIRKYLKEKNKDEKVSLYGHGFG